LLHEVEKKNKLISERYGSLVNEVKHLRQENSKFSILKSEIQNGDKNEIGEGLTSVLKLVENLENERDNLKNQVQAMSSNDLTTPKVVVVDDDDDDEQFAVPPTQPPVPQTFWNTADPSLQDLIEKHITSFRKQYEFTALSMGVSVEKVRFKGKVLLEVARGEWFKFLTQMVDQRRISHQRTSTSEANLEAAIFSRYQEDPTLREIGFDWKEMKRVFNTEIVKILN